MTYKNKIILYSISVFSIFTIQPNNISKSQSAKLNMEIINDDAPNTRELIDSSFNKVRQLSNILDKNDDEKKKVVNLTDKVYENNLKIAKQQKIIDSLQRLKERHKFISISKEKHNFPDEREFIISEGDTLYTRERPKGIKGWRIFDIFRKKD